jgi:hypothetical protein
VATDTTTYPWRIEQGEREQLNFPVLDDDSNLASIADWTVDAQIKDRPGGTVLYVFPPELAVVNGTDHVTLTVPGSVSAAWLWRTGWFRVVIAAPDTGSGEPAAHRVLEGTVVIDAS